VSLATLLPQLRGLRIDAVTQTPERILLTLSPTRRTAPCPACRRRSRHVHSRYWRTLTDLPLCGRPVMLRVHVRRFRCPRPRCAQRIFAERLPALADIRGRRTRGQGTALTAIGFALGGAAGARLATRLGVGASRSTLLRRVRAAPQTDLPAPRILGVDDWATRKGQRYGTILVDLEQHRPVDLLADRTSATFATWLREHEAPTVISRDRAGAYADGARRGAPDAVQVADRFHLLSNAGDALERVLARHHRALHDAAALVNAERESAVAAEPSVGEEPSEVPAPRLTRAQQDQAARRARRLTRYGAVLALQQQGVSQHRIAHQLGMSPKTVRRFQRADSFPERARPRRRPSMVLAHEAYLRERWTAGCHNAQTLWEEVCGRGFTGAPALVRRHVAAWRTSPARHGRAAQQAPAPGAPATPPAAQPTRAWSPRQARWALSKAVTDLAPAEQRYRGTLLDRIPELATAVERFDAFRTVVRSRDRDGLLAWLGESEQLAIPELGQFAAGMRRDQAAVEAAVTAPWSNGQTEGQINRLKALKRQMYGRAKLDLLRRRFLHAA
jgi:transposase